MFNGLAMSLETSYMLNDGVFTELLFSTILIILFGWILMLAFKEKSEKSTKECLFYCSYGWLTMVFWNNSIHV